VPKNDAAVISVPKKDADTTGDLRTRLFKLPAGFAVPQVGSPASQPSIAEKLWLEKEGVVFGAGAMALFDAKKGQLLVRNTVPELNKAEAIVAKLFAAQGTGSAASVPAVSKDNTADANTAAGDLFYLTAFQLCEDGEALERKNNKEGAIQKYLEARKTMLDVVRQHPKWQPDVVAYRLDVVEQNLFRLGHTVTRSAATGAGGQVRPKLPNQAPAPVSAALTRARKIILPRVQFAGATVKEAAYFLQIKSREFDKEEKDISKKGVRVDLRRGADTSTAMITLDLKDIPLSEAVRTVAELAGMTFHAGPASLVIEGDRDSAPTEAIQAARNKLEESLYLHIAEGKLRLMTYRKADGRTRSVWSECTESELGAQISRQAKENPTLKCLRVLSPDALSAERMNELRKLAEAAGFKETFFATERAKEKPASATSPQN
jgi:hypothetical protein